MKLLDKLKAAIFEEEEIEEEVEEKQKKQNSLFKDEVVKKIDIEKTIPKKIEIPNQSIKEEKQMPPKREHRMTPVIFDDEDFLMEDEPLAYQKPKPVIKEEPKEKEEPKKTLYAGYKDEKQKEKFKPSPIISPVYGFVGVSPVLEQPRKEELSSFNELFAKEKKDMATLDSVRQKAYGKETKADLKEDDDDLGLLYDSKQDESPVISKITLGDAEEYFDDLGLEYNVDYKDYGREKKLRSQIKESIITEEEIVTSDALINSQNEKEEQNELKRTKELEITKEQLQPQTAKEIKKVKKIKDLDISPEDELDDLPEEKNLYDLIDMMYEPK